MIEESETPGQGGRVGESDFLAERRARRATETGEAALQRRAEAAEATVRTLESHVSSLQQRLQEAEQERRRVSELSLNTPAMPGSGAGWLCPAQRLQHRGPAAPDSKGAQP